ncbi:hypothetical protein CHUAL_011119 [Chamberlinius hualienensis]
MLVMVEVDMGTIVDVEWNDGGPIHWENQWGNVLVTQYEEHMEKDGVPFFCKDKAKYIEGLKGIPCNQEVTFPVAKEHIQQSLRKHGVETIKLCAHEEWWVPEITTMRNFVPNYIAMDLINCNVSCSLADKDDQLLLEVNTNEFGTKLYISNPTIGIDLQEAICRIQQTLKVHRKSLK